MIRVQTRPLRTGMHTLNIGNVNDNARNGFVQA